MSHRKTLATLLVSVIISFILYAQSNRNCRGVEQQAVEQKLAAAKSTLPPEQFQQFTDKKKELQQRMDSEFAQSHENDQKITELLIKAAISDADLKARILERIKKYDPGLQGQNLLNAFKYTLTTDNQFRAELQPSLLGDPAYDKIATQMVKDDDKGTRTENLQLQLAEKIPPPDYDQKVTKVASKFLGTGQSLPGGLSGAKAFQDLLATVAYGQGAVAVGDREAGTAEASARWYTYAPDVTQSLESSRGVLRGINGATKQAALMVGHLDKVMPPAVERQQFTRNPQKELSREVATTTADAVQAFLTKSESTRLFREVPPPKPPSKPDPQQSYASQFAKHVKQVSDTIQDTWRVVVDR